MFARVVGCWQCGLTEGSSCGTEYSSEKNEAIKSALFPQPQFRQALLRSFSNVGQQAVSISSNLPSVPIVSIVVRILL